MEPTSPSGVSVQDYLFILGRSWRMIALLTSATLLVAVGASYLQTPVFEGTVDLAIEPVRSSSDAAIQDLILSGNVIETERRVITSRSVTNRVIDDLGLTMNPTALAAKTDVRSIGGTRIVTIRAVADTPEEAAAIANGFASAYLEHRRDRVLDEITAASANLNARATVLRDQIAAIDREILATGAAVGSLTPATSPLESQRAALVSQLDQITLQLTTLDPGVDAIRGGGEILTPAEIRPTPISPQPVRNAGLALVLGLSLGMGLAFVRDHFDDAVRSDNDLMRATAGIPIIGRLTKWENELADQRLITLVDPHDPISEEFQALGANVRFSLVSAGDDRADRAERPRTTARIAKMRGQSVLVTSATPGEGKTSVAGNLAVAAASTGSKVILVGADLRQPTVGRRFAIPGSRGLSDLLVDARRLSSSQDIAQHLLDVGVPRLRLLPAGTIPPNPTELIASNQLAWLHKQLTSIADLVIYDTPPLLAVADTLELSRHVDACLIVARIDKVGRRELQHASERLQGVGATIAGVIANGIEQSKRGAYGYGYGYAYGRYSYRPEGSGDNPLLDPEPPPAADGGPAGSSMPAPPAARGLPAADFDTGARHLATMGFGVDPSPAAKPDTRAKQARVAADDTLDPDEPAELAAPDPKNGASAKNGTSAVTTTKPDTVVDGDGSDDETDADTDGAAYDSQLFGKR